MGVSKTRKIRIREFAAWRAENNVKYCTGCGGNLIGSVHHYYCNSCWAANEPMKFCVSCGWLNASHGSTYCENCIPDKKEYHKQKLKHVIKHGHGESKLYAEKKLILMEIEECQNKLNMHEKRLIAINKTLADIEAII